MPNEGLRIHRAEEALQCGHCNRRIDTGQFYVTGSCAHHLCESCAEEGDLQVEFANQQSRLADELDAATASTGDTNEVQCPCCDDIVPLSDIQRRNIFNNNRENMQVCSDCFSDSEECDWCGNRYADAATDFHTVERSGSDEEWCQQCFESEAVQCEDCGNNVHNELAYSVTGGDRRVCEGCRENGYFTCSGCGELESNEQETYIESSERSYCPHCYEHGNFSRCYDCNEPGETAQMIYDDQDGNTYCRGCFPEEDMTPGQRRAIRGERSINNYSYKPTPNFFILDPEQRRLAKGLFVCGVETEVEVEQEYYNASATAKEMLDQDKIGILYCKSDSSINYGFEIVTHPFSFDWMRQNPEAFKPMFDLRKKNCKSYNTRHCGMHVHIARTAFRGRLHMLKFASMFFRHHEFVFRMSRRNMNEFSEYSNDNVQWDTIKTILKDRGGHGGDRYVINFAPTQTIEVRLFRGTLNPRGWYANIEFIKAVYDFTSEVGVKEVNPKIFSEWSTARAELYPNYLGTLGRLLQTQEGWGGLCA